MVLKVLKNFWLKNVDGQDHMLQAGMVLEKGSQLYAEALKQVHSSRVITLEQMQKGMSGALLKANSKEEISSSDLKKESSMIIRVGEPPLVEVIHSDNPRVYDKVTVRDIKDASKAKSEAVKAPEVLAPVVEPEPVVEAEVAQVEETVAVEPEPVAEVEAPVKEVEKKKGRTPKSQE